jgi:hypothetical protein
VFYMVLSFGAIAVAAGWLSQLSRRPHWTLALSLVGSVTWLVSHLDHAFEPVDRETSSAFLAVSLVLMIVACACRQLDTPRAAIPQGRARWRSR